MARTLVFWYLIKGEIFKMNNKMEFFEDEFSAWSDEEARRIMDEKYAHIFNTRLFKQIEHRHDMD